MASANAPGVVIVGAGNIARCHLRAMRAAPVPLSAICDPLPAQSLLLDPAAPTCTLKEALRRPDVGAVLVASPPHCHAEQAEAVMLSGRALLLEKPVALDADQARRLLQVAADTGAPVLVGHNLRHHPALRSLRSHAAGQLLGVRSTFTCRSQVAASGWRAGRAGGVWLDLALHHFDLWRYLTGEQVELLSVARSGDAWHVHGRSASGIPLQLWVSSLLTSCHRVEVLTQSGSWEADLYRDRAARAQHVQPLVAQFSRAAAGLGWRLLDAPGGGVFQHSYLVAQWRHFCEVWHKEKAPLASLEDGSEALQLALQAERMCDRA